MKANYQIKITVNSSQAGFEKNKEQIIGWLHEMVPIIFEERKVIAEKFFLHATNRLTSFCLN